MASTHFGANTREFIVDMQTDMQAGRSNFKCDYCNFVFMMLLARFLLLLCVWQAADADASLQAMISHDYLARRFDLSETS